MALVVKDDVKISEFINLSTAEKMVDNIKARSPDWTDPNGEVEKAFYDNMVAMKKGEL